MTATTSPALYTRYEVLRTFRNTRFFVFSLVFPLLMFMLIAGPNRNESIDGINFATYFMTGMVAWGSMTAVMAAGARIAAERSVGWNRQLRITPLRTPVYFSAKVVTGYLMALCSIAILYIAGISLGVSMSLMNWLQMTGLILVGLVPFAAMGVLLGHLLTVDSMGPALGGLTALFAFLGGSWGPLGSGAIRRFSELLPSYWLVQAGKVGLDAEAWPAKAWIVIAVWTAVLVRLVFWAYRRDTKRV